VGGRNRRIWGPDRCDHDDYAGQNQQMGDKSNPRGDCIVACVLGFSGRSIVNITHSQKSNETMEQGNSNAVFGRRRHARPSSSSDQNGRLIDPRDVLRILFRHKFKVISFFVSTITVAILGMCLLPKTYTSEARLYIKVGRHSVGVDPTANLNSSLQIHESRENEIRSLIDLVKSRVILKTVAERIGMHVILVSRLNATRADVREDDPRVVLHRAIKKLDKDISVGAGKKSSVITVSCKSHSAELSQRIVTELIDAYRNHHLKINSTDTFQFFSKQLKIIEQETRDVAANLATLKSKIGFTSLVGQQAILERAVTDLNREMQMLYADISEAEVRLDRLKAAHPELDLAHAMIGTQLTSTALDNMRQELYRLQIKKRSWESRYETEHPAIKSINAQLANSESDLRRQELLIAFSTLEAFKARRESHERSYKQASEKLHLLNKHESTIRQYEERLTIFKDRHQSTAKRMEESRLAEELDAQRVSNIKVEQPASFVPKPTSPKKSLILILGLLAGGFGGLSLAATCELLDHSYKTPEQLESSLNLPVLLSVPHIVGHGSPLM